MEDTCEVGVTHMEDTCEARSWHVKTKKLLFVHFGTEIVNCWRARDEKKRQRERMEEIGEEVEICSPEVDPFAIEQL